MKTPFEKGKPYESTGRKATGLTGACSIPPQAGRVAGAHCAPRANAPPPPAGALDARQAEALLNSAARDERDVPGRRKPAGRTPPRGKDW